MITINQYRLHSEMKLPEGAAILSVQYRFASATIWVIVDTNAPLVTRRFVFLKTGEECKPTSNLATYIGTLQADHDLYATHIFEDLR